MNSLLERTVIVHTIFDHVKLTPFFIEGVEINGGEKKLIGADVGHKHPIMRGAAPKWFSKMMPYDKNASNANDQVTYALKQKQDGTIDTKYYHLYSGD